MGNCFNVDSSEIIYIEEELYKFFCEEHISFNNINFMDFFPTIIHHKVATKYTVSNLISLAILKNRCDRPHYEDIITKPNKSIVNSVYLEETMIKQLCTISNLFNVDVTRLDIYDIVHYSGYIRNSKYFIDKLLEHPLLNPLTITIMYDDMQLFLKYIYSEDKRINVADSYRNSRYIKNLRYKNIMKSYIIQKNILIDRVFKNISIDIYDYVISLQII
jgi:hypothetical protein